MLFTRSGPFTYGSDGLCVDERKREPWRQLKIRTGYAEIPWIVAQLKLWGVPFRDTAADDVLRAQLQNAIGSIKVEFVGSDGWLCDWVAGAANYLHR
jgi:hypothetical protein